MTDLRILILGTVEMRAGERRKKLDPKAGLTLAALAWDNGRSVETDTLIHRVWDGDHPPEARGGISTYVSRLRAGMRELASTGDTEVPKLEGRTGAYVLHADPESVDAHRYNSLVGQARVLSESGSFHEALERLEEAARLWRGEPLAGLPGTWAEHVRSTLAERHLAAALLKAGIELRFGRYGDVVADLGPLAEEHPGHESLARHLALALYGCGRPSEASEVLQHIARHLVRKSGTDESERTNRLRQAVGLNQQPATELLPLLGLSVPKRTGEPLDDLPRDVDWVGREPEMRRLLSACATRPEARSPVLALEAIDGMAGAGKTALAVHAAHRLRDRFPDGATLLDLGGRGPFHEAMSPDAALVALLRRTGTRPELIPPDRHQRIALWRTTTRALRAVIILDNAAGPEQVEPLIPPDSASLVLITSRHRLIGLSGVRPITLDVLPLPDAVALFQARMGPERAADEDDAAELVRLCGLLPLAIEIAAGRLLSRPAWRVRDLADRLAGGSDRLSELRDARRELAGVFALSYRALDPPQQRVFRHLGLTIGPDIGPHAAAALTGLPLPETERALEDLLNVHFLQEPASHRYSQHDLLRDYARSLAASDPETADPEPALRRLVHHYLHIADQADRHAYPHRCRIDEPAPDPSAGADLPRRNGTAGSQWLRAEQANLLAVLEHTGKHAPPRTSALFAHVLAEFLRQEGHSATVAPHLRRAVTYWQNAGESAAEARALLDLGAVSQQLSDYGEALTSIGRALELARSTGDSPVEAEALVQLGITYYHTGRFRDALPHLQRPLSLDQRTVTARCRARCLNMLGVIRLQLGEHRAAGADFSSALQVFREIGDGRGQCTTLNNLGELLMKTRETKAASAAYEEAVSLAQAAGDLSNSAIIRMNRAGALLTESGDPRQALALYREALETFRGEKNKLHELVALNGIGRAFQALDRYEEAIPHHTAALALARGIGAANEEARALRSLGTAELRTGRFAQAEEHLNAALGAFRELQSLTEVVTTLSALAELHRCQGSAMEAEALECEADALTARLNDAP